VWGARVKPNTPAAPSVPPDAEDPPKPPKPSELPRASVVTSKP
jgi:hypothetical protein